MYASAAHFRFILLSMNLVQRGLSQMLQILLLIPGGFQLEEKARKLLILLNLSASNGEGSPLWY